MKRIRENLKLVPFVSAAGARERLAKTRFGLLHLRAELQSLRAVGLSNLCRLRVVPPKPLGQHTRPYEFLLLFTTLTNHRAFGDTSATRCLAKTVS